MHRLKWLERGLIAIGCACLIAFALTRLEAAFFQVTAAQALEREIMSPALQPEVSDTVGRLEIPRLHLSVIVMEGDDSATLTRAVGHVRGTSLPWEGGNTVMAGHRDTFFRPLMNLRDGDEIRLTTARGTFEYRVIKTEIVDPEDVSVLAPTAARSLTLVTCYPFVYVGRAPQRFIVHAR
jgi:sortase A